MEQKTPYLPDIWVDDTKMSVLFAPFREKSLNPSSWKQKMTFWIQTISDECSKSQTAIIDINLLENRFSRKGKVPLCLELVLDEMLRCNMIKQLIDKSSSPVKQKPTWLSWGYDTFLKTPVKWGTSYLSANKTKEIKYIMVEVLQKKCRQIIEDHYCGLYCDLTDSVIDYNQLWKKNQSICESETEFNLILEELAKEKKIAIHHENSQMLIKFCNREEKTVKPLLKTDIDIFRIKKTRDILSDRIDSLSRDIDKLKKEALKFKKANKTQALRCLRQKKILEKRIDKLTGSLDMLDNILDQITHSVSDEMVLKALESGTSAIKTLTGKMSIDHVNDVMDELAEVLEQQSDIQDQLSYGPSGVDVSRDELEAELEDLMEDDSELLIDNIIAGMSDLQLPSPSATNPHFPPIPSSRIESRDIITTDSPHNSSQNDTKSKIEQEIVPELSVPYRTLSLDMSHNGEIELVQPQVSYRQSPDMSCDIEEELLDNISSDEVDLSLDLPDVPSFVPSDSNSKKRVCLDS